MRDFCDDEIKKGLTYRQAAMHIMNSFNEVQKKLGMTILVHPVLENATKSVQQELQKQIGNKGQRPDVDNYVVKYSEIMIQKFN